METESSPKQMNIDVDEKERPLSRKRKLCELIPLMNGSRKRKCLKQITSNL